MVEITKKIKPANLRRAKRKKPTAESSEISRRVADLCGSIASPISSPCGSDISYNSRYSFGDSKERFIIIVHIAVQALDDIAVRLHSSDFGLLA